MNLEKFILAFVVFSAIIITCVYIIGDVNIQYGLDLDNENKFNNTFNQIDEMYNLSQDIKGQTIDNDVTTEESWESMTKGSYAGVRTTVKQSFGLFYSLLKDIAKELGVPAYFIVFALTALTITLIFAVIYLFMRFKA